MKTRKIKKILATAMAISTSATILPASQIAMASTGSEISSAYYSKNISEVYSNVTSDAIYENDFEDGELPDEIGGQVTTTSAVSIDENNAMMFTSNFDGTDDWDANKHEFSFNADSSETIPKGSTIQFDLLIPNSQKEYAGIIKCTGAVKDSEWAWKSASVADITKENFTDLGNGYSSKTVSISLASDVSGLKQVIAQISAYNCTYTGNLYVDNLKVIKNEASNDTSNLPTVTDLEWNFNIDASGWSYGGAWAYNGPTDNVVNYDASTIGSGALKLSVDYSNDSSVSWSEFKINNNLNSSIDFNGYNILTYDFIYNPSKMTQGAFQSKLFINGAVDSYDVINLDNATDIGDGLKKAKVTIKFDSKDVEIDAVTIGIIGANTNYKGDIYIDNIKLSQEAVEDIYVNKTAVAEPQEIVNTENLEMLESVKLVDSEATETTADLYAYLKGIGKTDKVLYGHQNDTHHKSVLKDSGSNSDTKDITGSIAAISGIDALSFTGSELQLTDAEKASGITLVEKAANLGIDAANEGAIITLSAHMPNFALVAEKGKDAQGNYDYSGYTPGVTSGNVVSRIMPSGDLNEVFNGYLDMIADYGKQLEAEDVPVLFRPFHENNGSWFWWGKAFCDEEAYKNLYRYTVEYLRDKKQIHNFLYVYSPNGPFQDKADYLSRYPGDEFIDIIAFDMYHDDPKANKEEDTWMNTFKETIELVQSVADDRGKLSAVSETGIRINGGGMPASGNPNKTWFSDIANIVSNSDMPYYMVWANFDAAKNFFSPFMVSDTKGHEMINEFIDYYNEEESVFADGVGAYSNANTNVGPEFAYGFITNPVSNNRILEPTTITASVKNYNGQVKFILKNKAGESIQTLNAILNNGIYSADITQAILDKIGQTIGSIELYSDDTKLSTIKAIFNIKEAEKDPKLVDNFESYTGEDGLLQNSWSSNAGAGCSVTPRLVKDNRNSGEYGLAFNYKISTEKTSEGWTGITKSLEADWSDSDALQIWIKPDGNGQKLVIQLTSNGEDFEVWLPEFAATTEAKLLTIPFSDFKGKNVGTFDATNIQKMGIWCNTIVPSGHSGAWTVNSTMYFDDIKAINTKDTGNTEGGSNSGGNSNSGGSSNSGGNSSSSGSSSSGGSATTDNNNSSSNGNTSTATKNNWVQENGKWKYVDENGLAVSNTWKQVNGKWYYFNGDSTMKTGWLKDKDNNWYYLEDSGAMKTDWIKHTDGNWYYLQSNGSMKKGWLLDKDNNWYYLQSNGSMKTGWLKDTDGNWYYLKANGAMAKNEYIDGYWLGENGAWK